MVCVTQCMAHMPIETNILEALRLEMRRGALVLAVLAALRRETYGYTLRTELQARGVEIDEGALYPMLRRLESQGLLTSQWREDAKRQKRFYQLSPDGAAALKVLAQEWRALNQAIDQIVEEGGA